MRQKKVIVSDITREVAEEAFAVYSIADAKQQRITAKMDIDITKIRERYTGELQALEEEKSGAFEKLHVFADNNRDLFGNKKSLEFSHGILGYRTGTPKLKTKKGYTWSSVTNLLKEFLPSYLRVVEEPAKDRLLSDREDPTVAGMMNKVGLFVDQEESFFVDPKKEEVV